MVDIVAIKGEWVGGGNTCEVSSGVIKEKYFWNLEFLILDCLPCITAWNNVMELAFYIPLEV